MDGSSAPGPDGFTRAFFTHCWDTVSNEVCNVVSQFFSHGFIEPGLNSSLMILIPKVPGAHHIAKFRPILLSNFIFKIITKILVDCLSVVIAKIISQE